MEPRPQRSSRATGPYISTGTPSPGTTGSGFGQPVFDASSAPPVGAPAIGYDPDYSPGQPLTPLRGPRGANIIGPLLAVAALAIIIAAVAFIVSQFRNGDGGADPRPTSVVAIGGSPTGDSENDSTETPDSGGNEPTQNPDDAGSGSVATSTPRVNRPTELPGDLAATEPDVPTDEAPVDRTRARQWFPTDSEIGEGYTRTDDDTRDEAGVAAAFPDPDDAAVKIAEFGWIENAYRDYELVGGDLAETLFINVSIHRFETEDGASDAVAYFAEGGQTAQSLTTVENAPELGEETIVLQGVIEGGNIYVIYIRQDNIVFRIGGLSPTGDPAAATTDVAEGILEQ